MKSISAAFIVLSLFAATAFACPVCTTEIGEQVRAGLFDDLGRTTVATRAPFAAIAGIVAIVHFGLPGNNRKR